MIHIRDLFEKINKPSKVKRDIKISRDIIRKIYFLLHPYDFRFTFKMRPEQIHMSIVDEFGYRFGDY